VSAGRGSAQAKRGVEVTIGSAAPGQRVKLKIPIDGRDYLAEVDRRVELPIEAPRIIVVSHQPNRTAMELLRVCIQAVQYFTPEPHELWIVDNNSPRENLEWLQKWPDINLVQNRTEPLPPEARQAGSKDVVSTTQQTWGSYANAVGLELAVRLIDPRTHYLMSMHMDALPCRVGWLSFLKSKLCNGVGAAGVRMDKTRIAEGVLHVLGYMVDFRLFRELNLDFFPELPDLDVGDKVTIRLRQAGYKVFVCPNTVWEAQLAEAIPPSSPLRDLHVDRSFDDDGNLIFLHLGRGVRKSTGEHKKGPSTADWIRIAREHLLALPES
jgi:hypothetical protein